MKSSIKDINIIFILILILTIVGCNSKPKYQGTALEPIYKLIATLYFNKNAYSDYTSVFANPKLAFTEEQFNKFRQKTDKSSFKYGSNSMDDIMNHMKFISEGANLVSVYYVEDVRKADVSNSSLKWIVENKDGKWLIKND